MSDHWHAIEAAFKQLGWNMTPIHMARAELELYVGYVNEYEPRMRKAEALCRELYGVFYPHLDESERVRLRALVYDEPPTPKATIDDLFIPVKPGDEGCDTNPITDWRTND